MRTSPLGWLVGRRPVRAKVGVWVGPRPSVENPSQGGCLRSSRWQLLLDDEDEDYVTLGGEVLNVLRYHRALLRPSGVGHPRIVGCPKPDLGHVDGTVPMLSTK